MSIKTIKGNLITLAEAGLFDIIIHGCNCFCTMGSGIAKEIKQRYPQAHEADLQTIKGDPSKLGKFTFATAEGNSFRIYNAYAQYSYGTDKVHISYESLAQSLATIAKHVRVGDRIGLPMIGAGLAGGDWQVILGIIENELAGFDVTIVEYDGSR